MIDGNQRNHFSGRAMELAEELASFEHVSVDDYLNELIIRDAERRALLEKRVKLSEAIARIARTTRLAAGGAIGGIALAHIGLNLLALPITETYLTTSMLVGACAMLMAGIKAGVTEKSA